MAAEKRRTSENTSEHDRTLAEPLQLILEQVPVAFAVTDGAMHKLIYGNAAFHALTAAFGEPKSGRSIGDLFDVTISTRLTALLDRALQENYALRDQFIGPLEEGGGPWSCTALPVLHDSELPQGLVIELRVASHTEVALPL